MMQRRTDLAVEAHEMWKESAGETTKLPGVRAIYIFSATVRLGQRVISW